MFSIIHMYLHTGSHLHVGAFKPLVKGTTFVVALHGIHNAASRQIKDDNLDFA